MVTGNRNFRAYFTINTYTLTYVATTGGTISGTAIQNVIYNTTGTAITAIANTGYTFSGWSDGYTGATRSDLVTGNKTLEAYYTINTYTLTFATSGNGTLSGTTPQFIQYLGTGTAVEAVAATGWTFTGWSDGNTNNPRVYGGITGDRVFTGIFTINSYDLSYTGSTGGTVTGTLNQNLTYGSTGTSVTAVANYGYTFS